MNRLKAMRTVFELAQDKKNCRQGKPNIYRIAKLAGITWEFTRKIIEFYDSLPTTQKFNEEDAKKGYCAVCVFSQNGKVSTNYDERDITLKDAALVVFEIDRVKKELLEKKFESEFSFEHDKDDT